MKGKSDYVCTECGFIGDCISHETRLCAECNKNLEQCKNCSTPCRDGQERDNQLAWIAGDRKHIY